MGGDAALAGGLVSKGGPPILTFGVLMQVTTENLDAIQTIWHDYFPKPIPPSQFASWLRMYLTDIVAEASKTAA